jgi:hypothetical protein
LVVVLALVLAGCGSDPQVLDLGGRTRVLVGGSTHGGTDVLVVGRVQQVGDCLGVLTEAGPVVVVWPAGTELVESAPTSVDVPDLGRLDPGQQVVLGGGWEHPPYPETVPDIPDGCPGDHVVLANTDQSD